MKSLPGSKPILIALGILCLALGTIGLFLPLLPTTPLILLAAWCFSRSSPRLHRFLLNNKLFGPLIENWMKHGAISLKAKIASTLVIVPFFAYTILFASIPNFAGYLLVLIAITLLGFIWSRPG